MPCYKSTQGAFIPRRFVLPLKGIGLILAIDWFLDRCRTTINVFGDSVGAAVIGKMAPPK